MMFHCLFSLIKSYFWGCQFFPNIFRKTLLCCTNLDSILRCRSGRITPQDIVDICYQKGINITEQDLQDLMDRFVIKLLVWLRLEVFWTGVIMIKTVLLTTMISRSSWHNNTARSADTGQHLSLLPREISIRLKIDSKLGMYVVLSQLVISMTTASQIKRRRLTLKLRRDILPQQRAITSIWIMREVSNRIYLIHNYLQLL